MPTRRSRGSINPFKDAAEALEGEKKKEPVKRTSTTAKSRSLSDPVSTVRQARLNAIERERAEKKAGIKRGGVRKGR